MLQKPQAERSDPLETKAGSSSGEIPSVEQAGNRTSSPLISILDLLTVTGLLVLTPIAWFLPQQWWPKLGRGVIRPVLRMVPRLGADIAGHINHCLGSPSSGRPETREILVNAFSRYFEDTLLLLKCYRPGDWKPEVEVRGLEYLEAAVSDGKGVVFWFSHFVFASLVSKIAMYRAGYAMSHLSHPRHGFSSTRFGMRFLNPIRTHIEERYLKERVTMGIDSAASAVEQLRERLLAGGLVSITARNIARKPVSIPFMTESLSLALGAPRFAQQAQATLLPVHVVQTDPGKYVAFIDPPIEVDNTQPHWTAAEEAAREYAKCLEAVVRNFPDQWLGWNHLHTTTKRNEH